MTALFQVDIATAECLEESEGRTEIYCAVVKGGVLLDLTPNELEAV
jgi:hypothetical protein